MFDGLIDAKQQSVDVEPGLEVVERLDVKHAVVNGSVDAER